MSESPVTVRPAEPADAAALARLVAAFGGAEGKPGLAHVTADWVERWAFGPQPAFEALLAEAGGAAVGYLAFYRAFSLFKGGPALLVENLYVEPAARRAGAGRALVAAAAAEAQARGWPRMELHARCDAPAARAFYEALGFHAPGEAVYRIDDAALAALAAGAGPPP